jgi:hypothetical protein
MRKTLYAFAASSAALAITIFCTQGGRFGPQPLPLAEERAQMPALEADGELGRAGAIKRASGGRRISLPAGGISRQKALEIIGRSEPKLWSGTYDDGVFYLDEGAIKANEQELDRAQEAFMESYSKIDLDSGEDAIKELAYRTVSVGNYELSVVGYAKLEELAYYGNEHALCAIANILPHLGFYDGSVRDAISLIDMNVENASPEAKREIKSSMEFHLRIGPLMHWAFAGERQLVRDLLERL